MDPLLLCEDLDLRVARDGECRVPVTVHNPDGAEDHYRFEILGDAARWGRIEPRLVPGVPAGGQIQVELVLRPPRDIPPGRTPFAVRCVSLRDPTRCAVAYGDVAVGASPDVDVVTAAVVPRSRRAGHYLLAVHNRGPAPAPVRLSAADPRQELGFALAPREFTVDPGGTGTAFLSVRPRRPKLVGTEVTHPFVVEHHGTTGTADRLPHRFEQRPLLGPLTAVATGVLLVALLGFGGLLAWPSLHASRSSAAPPPAATDQVLHGSYVVWAATPVGDIANQNAPAALVSRLQAAGIPARIVDSRRSPQLAGTPVPALLVVQDGFADVTAAQAACTAHRALAPACSAVPG